MRHALVARQLDDSFEIDSAGTHAYHAGEPPDPRAQRAAAERGIDLSDLRARRVTELDFERFDLILAMDEHNRSELEAIAEPHQHTKIRLFLEFGTGGTGTEVPDLGWQQMHPGLERRWVNLLSNEGAVQETLYLLRIDPTMYEFDVGYKPGAPQRLMDWQSETGALIVVNGGFFTPEGQATGLIVVDGQAAGTSFVGFGGMMAVRGAGSELRSLRDRPYDPYEPLRAALQSFPLLVAPDGQIGYPQEDGLADRRTVIAQDRQGRFLFILATGGTMTLHEMSRYLVESDLDLSIALNLDGGASTGILLADPPEGVAPFTLLPIVITVKSIG